MKKIAILMVMVLAVSIAFGQKNVRQTASNHLKSGKLDKAVKAINECVENPATIQDARAWFIRGNIYLEIANSTDEKYTSLDPDPLPKVLESYSKAIEYDTKKNFYEDIFAKLNWQRNNLYNSAVDAYNQATTALNNNQPELATEYYSAAMNYFAGAVDVIAVADIPDTVAMLNTAYCATLAQDYENAKKYYLMLLEVDYKTPALFVSLSDIYRKENDLDNAMKIIRQGKEIYPNDPTVFLGETSVFLTFNMTDQALNNLLEYIKTDTSNYSVYFALGTIYDKIVNDTAITDEVVKKDAFEKALIAYKRSLELNPEYFDVYYNIGALCVNTASIIDIEANALPLDQVEKYDRLKGEANKYLGIAAPYLEKAIAMQPNDVNTLQTLRQIYSRTKQKEKLREVNAKIDSLTQ